MGEEKNKANSSSKLIRFMKTPFRILSRTRDYYIQSFTNCTGRMSSGSIMGCSTGPGVSSTLPRSFSVNSSKPRNSSVDDDLRDLIRVTSQKGTSLKDKVIAEILLQQQEHQARLSPMHMNSPMKSPLHMNSPMKSPLHTKSPMTSPLHMNSPRKSPLHTKSPISTIPDGLQRSQSSSVNVGIERIDEDRPSDFGKAESPVQPLLHPRSKSYGISKIMKTSTTS